MQDQLKEANLETFEQQMESIFQEYPDPPNPRPRKTAAQLDRAIRKWMLEGTMCGGKPKTFIMSLSSKLLKSRFPRKVGLRGNKLRAYLRAKYKDDPDSLNLREAKEWLEHKLQNA